MFGAYVLRQPEQRHCECGVVLCEREQQPVEWELELRRSTYSNYFQSNLLKIDALFAFLAAAKIDCYSIGPVTARRKPEQSRKGYYYYATQLL